MNPPEVEPGRPSALVEEMHLSVMEESRLWEMFHGPYDPVDCSRQLLTWFDQGLIELYADPPEDTPRPRNRAEWQVWNNGYFLRVLDLSAARDLLARPERWTRESEDGFIHLCPPRPAWLRTLRGGDERDVTVELAVSSHVP